MVRQPDGYFRNTRQAVPPVGEINAILSWHAELYRVLIFPSRSHVYVQCFVLHFQIGTRFRNQFGEHFYRMVVIGFQPSMKTLIVRVAVLLDPSEQEINLIRIVSLDSDFRTS
jgi:hypothetical protein